MTSHQQWIQGAVIYQIYPRSFYDSNGDGVGDLPGIVEKLDYLGGNEDSLGIKVVWISPFYTSPMADFGYDISDYCDVDPIFGTLEDFKTLVAEAHKRDIKILMDLVPNHTSDQHAWFRASRSSKTDPKRDWYVWRDPAAGGGPPSNWVSVFGGSAWELDKQTGQYYLHSFLTGQPDLNWDNSELREAMKNVMRFWLDLGADGFRVDAIPFISKDPELRDEPINPKPENDSDYQQLLHLYSRDGPRLFDYIGEMTAVIKEYPGRFMITEGYPMKAKDDTYYLQYYERVDANISMPFNFGAFDLPWEAHRYRKFVDYFQGAIGSEHQSAYSLSNHDNARLATRLGRPAARTAAMLMLTLPGVPTVYYGDEIGMTDVHIPPDRIRDPGLDVKDNTTRDKERTPMQWDDTDYAGFSTTEPWLPVGHNRKHINVQTERQDETSFFNLYKQLLRLRTGSQALRSGTYKTLDLNEDIFGFVREHEREKLTILLNFSTEDIPLDDPRIVGNVILSTYCDRHHTSTPKSLRPHEGIILRSQ